MSPPLFSVAVPATVPAKITPTPTTIIRPVWRHNLDAEFALIRSAAAIHRIAAMDTEFPGVVHRSPLPPSALSSAARYSILKSNVDSLHLIQLGLTLSDSSGNLPDLGTRGRLTFAWEFNFHGFNVQESPHSPDSIHLLKTQGINFDLIRTDGIDPRRFAELFLTSGLVLNNSSVRWVTFHSCYDFGYLVKTLTNSYLPDSLEGFLGQVRVLFGEKVFDMKHMMRFCDSLYGGLERVAKALRVERAAGRGHQAGSDSLLTWQVFCRMREVYFGKDGGERHAGVLYGLEVY